MYWRIIHIFLIYSAVVCPPARAETKPYAVRRVFEGLFTDKFPSLVDGDPESPEKFGWNFQTAMAVSEWRAFLQRHPELEERRKLGAAYRKEFLEALDKEADPVLDALGVDQSVPRSVLRSYQAFLKTQQTNKERKRTQLEIEVAAKTDVNRRWDNNPDWTDFYVRNYYNKRLRKYEEENLRGAVNADSDEAFQKWRAAEVARLERETAKLEALKKLRGWKTAAKQITPNEPDALELALRQRTIVLHATVANLATDLKQAPQDSLEKKLREAADKYDAGNNSAYAVRGPLELLPGANDLFWWGYDKDHDYWEKRSRLAQLNPLAQTVEHRVSGKSVRPGFWKKVAPYVVGLHLLIHGGKIAYDEGLIDPLLHGAWTMADRTWDATGGAVGRTWNKAFSEPPAPLKTEDSPPETEKPPEAPPRAKTPMDFVEHPPSRTRWDHPQAVPPDLGEPGVVRYQDEWASFARYRISNVRAKPEELPQVLERATQKDLKNLTPWTRPEAKDGPDYLLETMFDHVPVDGRVPVPRPRDGMLVTLDLFDKDQKRLEPEKDFTMVKTEDGIPVIQLSKEKAGTEVGFWAGYVHTPVAVVDTFLLPSRVEAVAEQMHAAGFTKIAEGLTALAKKAHAEDRFVWTSEAVKVLSEESRYTFEKAKKPREIPGNPFAPLTGFIDEEGRFCTQCTGASRMVKIFLDAHDAGEPYAHVNRQLLVFTAPKNGIFGSLGHLDNSRGLEGEAERQFIDATPTETDKRGGKPVDRKVEVMAAQPKLPPPPKKEETPEETFVRKAENTLKAARPTVRWGQDWVYYHRFRFRGQVDLVELDGAGGEPPEPPPGLETRKIFLLNEEAIAEARALRAAIIAEPKYRELIRKGPNLRLPPQEALRVTDALLAYAEGRKSLEEFSGVVTSIDRSNPNLLIHNEADIPRAMREAQKHLEGKIDQHVDRYLKKETRNFPLLADASVTWPTRKLLGFLVRGDWAPVTRYELISLDPCRTVESILGGEP